MALAAAGCERETARTASSPDAHELARAEVVARDYVAAARRGSVRRVCRLYTEESRYRGILVSSHDTNAPR